jgi:hypothetical protein
MTKTQEEQIWTITAPGRLSLIGSKIYIILLSGPFPYHIHRIADPESKDIACFGCAYNLTQAKALAKEVYRELTEMGVVP